MPNRKKSSNRRKQRNSQSLKDFFPVERTIKKCEKSHDRINGLSTDELDQCLASCTGTVATEASFTNNVPSVSSKQQRKRVWTTLKDFYPVRRSSRKPESEIKKERFQEIEEALISGEEKGLEVCYMDGKGRGVVASKPFQRGDFVVEYRGDLIDQMEAKRREAAYAQDSKVGCYMYYFQHKNQAYCVDATAETCYLGRLINHSAKEPNCVTRVVEVRSQPHLILVASRDIEIGEELLYDYGDRSREAVQANPWLLNS